MLHRPSRTIREENPAAGFTVLDLLVAGAALAIVLAIAIPTVVMPRLRANDTTAQIQARRALMVQRTVLSDGNGYGTAADLEEAEPTLDYTEDAVVSGKVFVRVEGDTVTLASRTASGTCYWIRDTDGVASYAAASCDVPVEARDFGASWGDE